MPEVPSDLINSVAIALMMLLLALTLLYTITMYMSSRKQMQQPKPKLLTRIECENGDYDEVRDYMDGDYVGKVVGNCPKCSSPLTITAIYKEIPKTPQQLKT